MSKIDSRLLAAFAATAVIAGACSAGESTRQESAGAQPTPTGASGGVLASSAPANGARLRTSPRTLVLTFNVAVRLAEVTVAGADGQLMPMMVSSAGATRRYELPLEPLTEGAYTVRWRAVDERGTSHEGSIAFQVG